MRLMIFVALFLSAGMLSAGGLAWETDFEKAKATAKAEGKTLLLNFTGSDWCGWCKRLKREVFNTKEFKAFAEENLVMVYIDFPRYKNLSRKQQVANQKLAYKYGVRGYPTVLLLSPEEKLLLTTGYMPGGPEGYISHLQKALPGS